MRRGRVRPRRTPRTRVEFGRPGQQRPRVLLWLVFGLLAVALGGAIAAFASSAWVPRVVQEVPATYVFPGTPPTIPWPQSGQAALTVSGLGGLGTSGQVATAVPIASVAKVLTAYQILTDHPLAADAPGPSITVSREDAVAYGRQLAEHESLVPVVSGEALTERQALQALLLASADNIAQLAARWDAGSVPAFLTRMNKTATRLGMTHSRYTDPSGLDRGTVSTAPDQLLLAAAAIRDPTFTEIVGERSAVIPVAGTIRNYNALLGRDGVIGIKTGSTLAAGGCLMFGADLSSGPDGRPRRVYGVVLGQPGSASTILPHALAAARRLIESAQSVLATATVVPVGYRVAVVHEALRSDRVLTPQADVGVVGWPGMRYTLRVSGPPENVTLTVQSQAEPGYQVVSSLK
ncbi:MAG TPA: D-alanyl-D-alanine carboxypeptidase [Actinocrinis sp.]|uniref:D-alanyl-D-alanine carboxypeptidase family protein n=1 Tax=Actinocrinis sp. TaxID=1920516 RepID=UPI002DDD0ED1|nr:D-alanyl-D-alanine carboxypeptidase [Actinocrinis sp.]HEV2346304.1 D-alanyl-D-alanine carboxypeptidase [Actinocrinis sp.]